MLSLIDIYKVSENSCLKEPKANTIYYQNYRLHLGSNLLKFTEKMVLIK